MCDRSSPAFHPEIGPCQRRMCDRSSQAFRLEIGPERFPDLDSEPQELVE
jgi:hypothetical protein